MDHPHFRHTYRCSVALVIYTSVISATRMRLRIRRFWAKSRYTLVNLQFLILFATWGQWKQVGSTTSTYLNLSSEDGEFVGSSLFIQSVVT